MTLQLVPSMCTVPLRDRFDLMRLVSTKVVVPAGCRALGVHGLLEADAELFPYWRQLLEVFFVLALVFYFHLDACVHYSLVLY